MYPWLYTCTCTHVYVHVHVPMVTYMYMYPWLYTCTCTHGYIHVHVPMVMYMYIHWTVCLYIFLYIYLHISIFPKVYVAPSLHALNMNSNDNHAYNSSIIVIRAGKKVRMFKPLFVCCTFEAKFFPSKFCCHSSYSRLCENDVFSALKSEYTKQ